MGNDKALTSARFYAMQACENIGMISDNLDLCLETIGNKKDENFWIYRAIRLLSLNLNETAEVMERACECLEEARKQEAA